MARLKKLSGWGLTVGLVAMLLAPAGAYAAPGDLAYGTVYSDANKNNTLDTGAPGQNDVGLAGVTVNALDAGGDVVATTTTAADGSWSILEADAPGAVKIEIVTDTANGDVYATHTTTSGDNAFVRDGGLNRATVDLAGGTDVELNALVYPVWTMDLALAGDPEGWNGLAVRTGTDPFDDNDSAPGLDSGMDNDRVRSSDIVSYNWSLTTASEEGSLGDSYKTAVFEQTVHLEPGAVANFAANPAICETTTITAYPSGTVIAPQVAPPTGTTELVLTCALGELGEDRASLIFPTLVQPHATSVNGTKFTTTARVYGVDENGTATSRPSDSVENGPIEITAAPRYDIEKNAGSVGSNEARRVIDGELVTGMFSYYTIQISTDRKAGVEAFAQPISIEESFWGVRTVEGPNGEAVGSTINDLEWYLEQCIPTNANASQGVSSATSVYGKIGMTPNATEQNSVRDSGTCTIGGRDGNPKTGNYELTFDGIDLSGVSYPTQTAGGQPLAAGPFYVASYRIQVFIPMYEIDRMQGTPDDATGELSVFNRISGFDPVGASGAENYGGDGEPGYCEAGYPNTHGSTNCDPMEDDRRSNNVAGPSTVRVSPGNWSKRFWNVREAWSFSSMSPAGIPELSGDHMGDAMIQPGEAYTSMQVLRNPVYTWDSAQMCDVFDSKVLQLVPLSSDSTTGAAAWDDGQYSAVLYRQSGVNASEAEQRAYQSNWVIRYGSIDLSGDNPNTGMMDPVTDRYEGDWSNQRAASHYGAACATPPPGGWHENPEDVPGGIDAVNVVWASLANGSEFPGDAEVRWLLTFEQRDTYNGGLHDGEKIPSGTVAANFGAVKTSVLSPNWSAASYIPGAGTTTPLPSGQDRHVGENGSTQGDRWTVTRALMSLQKRTIAGEVAGQSASGVADFGVTGSALAGKPVIWEIVTDLRAASDEPAPVENVVVTDVLPADLEYDEAGTQAFATDEGFPMPTSVTANPDGTTTLIWNLGTRTPNQPLPVLKIATITDSMAPNNTVLMNKAEITADGIVPVSSHKDDHTVRLEQAGGLQLKKSVDRTLDLQNDNQVYTLQLKNFSPALSFLGPTIIEVLPYNGDATNDANVNRSPASDFAGSNKLNAAPVAYEFDGVTPRAGTFYYTTDDPSTVSQHLSDNTSSWSPTFTADATAFKFVADTALATAGNASKSGIVIEFQTDQLTNNAGDLYTNRFTAFSDTLKNGDRYQLLTSNTVSVRVVGFSLGDLVWIDTDGDGKYTDGVDRVVPEGVKIEVYDDSDTKVGETTTDADGRWVVNKLTVGDYYAVIPASEFAAGGLLEGYVPALNPELDPNTDLNETSDHHTVQFGGGVRSSGLISLEADTDQDPLVGLEPLGDNVAGLVLPPMTGDDFTNLTLDLALIPPAGFTIEKVVDGDAAEYGTGPFTIEVSCVFNGAPVHGYPKTITLTGGGSETLFTPLGSICDAVETGTGGATTVAVTPESQTINSEDGEFVFTVTNTFDAGSFKILKEVEGVGAGFTDGEYVFDVACTFNGSTSPVFTTQVTLTGTDITLESEVIDGLPVGATCVITEVGNGGADETPAPVQIVIDGDPETVQIAGFVNEFSAGQLEVSKLLDGDAAEDPFVQSLVFDVALTCQIVRGDDLIDVYGGIIQIVGGETVIPEIDGEPVLLPVGTHCFGEEITTQGASDAVVDYDSYENAVIVTAGNTDTPQQVGITATNTFDQAALTVSKLVEGPAPAGAQYSFELACTYPVTGVDGVLEQVEYPLAAEDTQFTLAHGQSRTITVLAGVTCAVVETDVPTGATVTVLDSDDTTAGGDSDGVIANLAGADNTVKVTNTFPPLPDLPVTGAQIATWVFGVAGLLVAVGVVLLVVRRRNTAGTSPDVEV